MDQVAALPFRILPGVANLHGEAVDILLVTSRDTGRWVLPKGNVEPGETATAAAAREAAEEAGVAGRIGNSSIGSFRYSKRGGDGSVAQLTVAVYPLAVVTEAADWPERKERERRWFTRAEAAAVVDEDELAELIGTFAG
jgi:uncharacterized protein